MLSEKKGKKSMMPGKTSHFHPKKVFEPLPAALIVSGF
jgi:hypothetical protein